MDEMNPTRVVSWLREHAKQCIALADGLERTFAVLPMANGHVTTALRPAVELRPETIRATIGKSAVRIGALAKLLGVTTTDLAPMLTEAHGFVRGERGWIRRAENVAV